MERSPVFAPIFHRYNCFLRNFHASFVSLSFSIFKADLVSISFSSSSTRGYQTRERLLILVPLHATKPGEIPKNIPYRNNVLVLDPSSFIDYIGLDKEFKYHFISSIKLARDAIWKNDGSKEKLHHLADMSRIFFDENDFSQKSLERYLNDSKTKLSTSILKYSLDRSDLRFWNK